jgi:Domain of unknown function (DUF4091)
MSAALALALLFPAAASPRASAAPAAWTISVLDRIGPESAPRASRDVALEAGRGEIVSFQVAVRAPAGGLHALEFAVTPLAGPGASLGGSNVVLYRENFVTLALHSPVFEPLPKDPNLPLRALTFPDALIPFVDPLTGKPPKPAPYVAQPIDLPGGTDAAYWVDVAVPPGAPSGIYRGSYTVSSQQGSVTGNVRLNVRAFTVPLMPTLLTNMNSSTRNPPGETQLLLGNKLMPNSVPPADEAKLIANDGLDTENLGFWSGAYYGHCDMKPPPSVAAIEKAVALHDPRLALYDFSADEIERCHALFPRLKAWARNLHAAGIPNLVTIAPVPELYDDGSGTGRSAVDIWTVLPVEYEAAQAYDPPRVDYVRSKGDSVWFYTALVQDQYSPKWELDFLPLDYRISTGFLNASLGLTGTLYWSVDYWTAHPWTDVEYPGGCSGNYCWSFPGEGFMVYPGHEAGLQGVTASLRLKYVRDGVQDYERYAILKRCGHEKEALQSIRTVAASYENWTRNGEALLAVSHHLADEIVQQNCSP